jgi:hypothetical protein
MTSSYSWYWVRFDTGVAGGVTLRGPFYNQSWAEHVMREEKRDEQQATLLYLQNTTPYDLSRAVPVEKALRGGTEV